MNLVELRDELAVQARVAAASRADWDRVCKWITVFRAVCKYESNGVPGLIEAACQMYDLGVRDLTVVTDAHLANYLERSTVQVWFHIGSMPLQLKDWQALTPLNRDKLSAYTPWRHHTIDTIVAQLKELESYGSSV